MQEYPTNNILENVLYPTEKLLEKLVMYFQLDPGGNRVRTTKFKYEVFSGAEMLSSSIACLLEFS